MKTIGYLRRRLKEALSDGEMPLDERLGIYEEVDSSLEDYKKLVMQYGLGYNDEVDEYEYVEKPNEYETKYRNLEEAYRNRFFADGRTDTDESEETEETYEGLDELLESYEEGDDE